MLERKESHRGRWLAAAIGLGRAISHIGPVTTTVTINKPPLEVNSYSS